MLSVATLLIVGRTNQHMKFQVHICNMHGLPIFDAQPHCNLTKLSAKRVMSDLFATLKLGQGLALPRCCCGAPRTAI